MVISFPGGGWLSGRPHGNGAEAARFAMLNQVRAYWEALREGPRLPLRSRIDPRGIEQALEHAFIIERIAPGHARFRLAGMHLVDLMGMEVRGMPASALIDPMGRTRMAEVLEQVFAGPAVLTLRLEAERGIGKPALEGRMILLPLRDDVGRPTLALGCLATTGDLGRRPRRFAIAGADLVPLPMPGLVPVPGLHEPPAPFRSAPAGRPHLRLVKSDE